MLFTNICFTVYTMHVCSFNPVTARLILQAIQELLRLFRKKGCPKAAEMLKMFCTVVPSLKTNINYQHLISCHMA